jgi:nucleoside-diphosphate-sugar epimerase
MNIHPFLTKHQASDQRWLQLQNAHLFFTGGTGLFGRWFIAALLDANQRLGTNIQATILTRNPDIFLKNLADSVMPNALHFLIGDVQSFIFPPYKFSHVMHMATTSAHETFAGEDSLAKFNMLTKGTERVMLFAVETGAKKVLFTSSGVAYGAHPEGLVTENYQGAPYTLDGQSGLGQGKRAAEFLCSYYAEKHNINLTIARCFSFAGPGLPLDIHYAIGNFIHDALFADEITVKGDGSPMRSFLYTGDLVHWLLAMLVEGNGKIIYNLGSDQALSILDLANAVKNTLAPHKKINVLGNNQHSVGNFNRSWYVPDISKAKKDLQLNVWTNLEEMILSTANAIR